MHWKELVAVLLLSSQASCAQVKVTGVTIGGVTIGGVPIPSLVIPGVVPNEPTAFVNMRMCDASPFDVTATVKASGGTYTDLQTAANAWGAAADQSWHVIVDAGLTFSYSSGFIIPSKTGATKCLVIDSSTPITANTVVCSGGWQDNLTPATHIYHRDYQCPTDVAKLYEVICTVSPCSPVNVQNDAGGVGSHHVLIRGAHLHPSTSIPGVQSIVTFDNAATDITKIPAFLGIEQSYFHGDATDAGFSGNNVLANFMAMYCHDCWAAYNYADRGIRPGAESHDVGISNGGYRIKIVRNVFEGMSSGYFCGGGPVGTGFPNVSCTDLEVGQNRFTYPPAWLGSSNTSCSGQSCVRKNASEVKTFIRQVSYGNIFENVDVTGGQSGPVYLPDQTKGNDVWDRSEDAIIMGNIIRHGCEGTQNNAHSGDATNTIAFGVNRVLFANNLYYDVGTNSSVPGCTAITNSMVHSLGAQDTAVKFSACTNVRDASGVNSTITCPSSTGFTQTDVSVGDMIHVSNCADTTFNNANLHAPGFFAISPTSPTTLSVTYPNAGTANASTTACILHTFSGWARNITHIHETAIAPGAKAATTDDCSSAATNPWVSSEFNIWQGLIFIGVGFVGNNGACTTGTAMVTQNFNPANLIFNYQVYPGLVASSYTEVKNGTLTHPPTTVYFPATDTCSGASPTSACLGMKGFMNGTAMNGNATDWHDYSLLSNSVFAAGQSQNDVDGQSMGADFSAIDNLQIVNQYPCVTACGGGLGSTPNTH